MTKEQNKETATWFTPMCFLTTITFVILKLVNIIDWNWWWIFAPLWMPLTGFILIVVILIIIALIINKVIK